MKRKLLTIVLILAMMSALTIVVGAKAAGPFDTLEEAVGNRVWLQREYVIGGIPYWGGVGIGGEGPFNLMNDDTAFKYGAGGNLLVESEGYWAVWKYDKAYVADSFIFATANDNESSPRRMGNGWTISGGNGENGPWTVLYTGRGDDYENLNFTFFRIDLPNNATAFQYYKLFAEEGFWEEDGDAIQLSVAGVTVKDAVAPVAAAPAPFRVAAADFILYEGWYGSTDGDARRDDPEVEVAMEFGSSEFGSNVGWTNQGEWLEYHINVPGAGKYVAQAMMAGGGDNVGVELLFKGEPVGETGPIDNNGWQSWAIYDIGEIDLMQGINTVRVNFLGDGGFNIAGLIFTPVGWVEPAPAPAQPEPAVGGGDPAEVELPAPAPTQAAPAPAPRTFDPISLIAVSALVSAAGIIVAKKRNK